MKTTITASTLSDVTKMLKTISDALVRGIDTLIDWGIKVSDGEEVDGVVSYTIVTPGGNTAKVTLTPVMNKSDVWNVQVKANKSGKSQTYRNVKDADVDDAIGKGVSKLFGENLDEVKSTKRLNVTLQRICSNRGDTINLTSVSANYNASQALDDLTTILSEDAFADTITETPTSFEIVDEGDSFDVTPTDCSPQVDPCYMFTEIMSAAYKLFHNIQCIHWNAKGNNFHLLHNTLNDYYYTINYQIDNAAEWCVEFCGWAPHPSSLISRADEWNSIVAAGFTAEAGFDLIRTCIQDYVSTLELYYCNLDHDIQSVLDEWIRGWKSQSEYIITRILKP